MDYQELCNPIFCADQRTRYVTVTDSHCSVPAGGTRPSLTPSELIPEEGKKIDLQVAILDDLMRSWAESLGRARFALMQHEKAHMLIVPFNDRHVELSIGRSMPIEEIGRIVAVIENALRRD